MVKVIPMEKKHINKVYEIEKLCFSMPWSKESLRKEIEENDLAYYILVLDGDDIAGYAGMWIILDEGHITNIAVHPKFRGKGFGELLVNSLIKECKKRKLTSITLEVRKSNTIAINLYTKFGFKNKGVRKRYYEDTGEDAIIMWKYI
ncbi:ribosomal protein S18-alanine N-acetyltransferase [Defluviitalea phaphyphila]|uniref:ribosomal protein S18-alanine N-acetyltransferase n=1 Tax=Defluviitalea phaphyphila TaxID=1473580 RepID=UPI0007300870|nr:ribosomal protein S18-alanine N-acetyltransferase [Defluviitalea phaphyphila]